MEKEKRRKLSKIKSDILNQKLSSVVCGGNSEQYCDWYVRLWTAPQIQFEFIRRSKKSRYPKHQKVIMIGGGFSADYTEDDNSFEHTMLFNNLWCAN